jgi:hypothetical protein
MLLWAALAAAGCQLVVGPYGVIEGGPGDRGTDGGRDASSDSGGDSGMPCILIGDTCSPSEAPECCQTGMGAGCTGTAPNYTCHPTCSTGSDCDSGCCAPAAGETYSVCALATPGCSPLGGSCPSGAASECCQTGPGIVCGLGADCLRTTDTCVAACSNSVQCPSTGCCVGIAGPDGGELPYGYCGCGSACGHFCI